MSTKQLAITVCTALSIIQLGRGESRSKESVAYSIIDKEAAYMKPYQMDRHAAGVEQRAAQWSSRYLADAYLPPAGLRYVFLPGSNSVPHVDMLRLRYSVGDETITISQTSDLFGVTVCSDEFSDDLTVEDKEELVNDLVRRLFREGNTLVLKSYPQPDGYLIGGRDLNEPSETPLWLMNVLWWWNSEEVGFLCIKDDGGDNPTLSGISPAFNRYWFTLPGGKSKELSRAQKWANEMKERAEKLREDGAKE